MAKIGAKAEQLQDTQFTDVSQRIDVLETVARTTFDRLTSADLPSPSALSEQLDPVGDGGHIQFVPYDPAEYLFFQTYGLSGSLGEVRPGRDSMAVTSSNAGGSKIDLFLERHLRYDVNWNPQDGSVRGTITATLHNTAPASGLPDYVIGSTIGLPRGTNKSFVSIYTLYNVTGARVGGQPAPVQSEQEAQHNVYSTFVTIPPGETATIELDVSGIMLDAHRYRLEMAEQPLVIPEQAEVNITVAGDRRIEASNGVEVEGRTARWTGPLDRPQRLTVRAGG